MKKYYTYFGRLALGQSVGDLVAGPLGVKFDVFHKKHVHLISLA
jgi:hypothetical protein